MQHTAHSKGLAKVLGLTPPPKRLAQEDEEACVSRKISSERWIERKRLLLIYIMNAVLM